MARIRTIKPEFFTSDDIVSLTPLARLFYVSLWCEADREGRLSWNLRTFKLRYFPGDDCSISDLADELIDAGLVIPYEVDGKPYAEIPTFLEHQVINNREAQSVIPPRAFDASGTRESGVSGEGKEGRNGREGKGKEGERAPDGAGGEDSEIFIPLNDGSEYVVKLASVAEWEQAYPRIDVMAELRKARAWCVANPRQRKTRGGAAKFLNGWLSRASERAAPPPAAPSKASLPGGGRREL